MKTIPIDEQMRQSGERAMKEAHEKFVQPVSEKTFQRERGHCLRVQTNSEYALTPTLLTPPSYLLLRASL